MEAASVLWQAFTKHFEAGDGINPDYLLRELMMRMPQLNEKVDAYAENIESQVTNLRQAKGLAAGQLAAVNLRARLPRLDARVCELAQQPRPHDAEADHGAAAPARRGVSATSAGVASPTGESCYCPSRACDVGSQGEGAQVQQAAAQAQ
ncbi:hypothetical protein PF008_g15433 [Phytophthora fragariae]|uniref:Uncharacterized protein n=1 Tax=Phytophthora fragariae TaxID=53985 RepID=A0A6G0RFH9_9STRA|nr:hypothetical protein PF008_g15433 [Phytophthora fragariae]